MKNPVLVDYAALLLRIALALMFFAHAWLKIRVFTPVLSFCNSPQMNSPEAYIQFKPGLITEDGEVTNEETAEFLRKYMMELHAFIVRGLTVHPRNS